MPLHHGRLFVFGCSFTKWLYPTWNDILATQLKPTEYYNYGQAGAGNLFIFLKLLEADMQHNFTESDTVIVQWTNICREDRYSESTKQWVTPGNIFTQTVYNSDFVDAWANDSHYAVTNFSLIKSAIDMFTNKTQFINLQMLDLLTTVDQWSQRSISDETAVLVEKFSPTLRNHMSQSFYSVLWDNNIDNKISACSRVHTNFSDYHPSIQEHADYISTVLRINWDREVCEYIKSAQIEYFRIVREELSLGNDYSTISHNRSSDLENFVRKNFYKSVEIDASQLMSI